MPKGLIFDCDGTVLNSMEFYWPTWVTTCKKHNIHITKRKFYECSGLPVRTIYETLISEQNLNYDAKKIDQIMDEKKKLVMTARENLKGPIEPIPATVKVIKEFYGKIPMAIASSGHRSDVVQGLKANDLLRYFGGEKNVVCQEDLPKGTPCKPAPDIFLEAARRIGVSPKDCRGYEDADVGMIALRKAGMEAVDVRDFPSHPYQKLKNEQISCYFSGSPDKLLSLVFVMDGDRVLLGKKKRGFGKDKFNGFGGKITSNESIEECAARELLEECGLKIHTSDLSDRGTLDFTMLKDGMVGSDGIVSSKLRCRVFTVRYDLKRMGSPEETEEMKPEWFYKSKIPLSKMWLDDRFWLPKMLKSDDVKMRGGFVFGDEGTIGDFDLKFL